MNSNFYKPFTFDRVVRMLISVIAAGIGIYIIYVLRNVLLPFLIAWLMAYLLNPIVRFFQQKLRIRNRVLAVIVTLLSVTGLFALLITLLVPTVEKEVVQINNLIANYKFSELKITGLPKNVENFIYEHVDFSAITEAFNKENATETAHFVLPALKDFVSGTLSILFGVAVIFVMILYLVFILIDYDKMSDSWIRLIPSKHRPFVSKIGRDVQQNMNTYFRHQALICVIAGCLYAIGFQIIGLPLAIIMGAMIAVLHMVPYLQAVSILPAILLCWLKASQGNDTFWGMIGLTILVYAIIQCIIDGLLVPRIMGKAMGLNPAIILLSLSIWGALLGIIGMIIAIPLTTLILSYYQSFIDSISEDDVKEKKEKPKEIEIGD